MKDKKKYLESRLRAFSLIEVIVATAITAVIATSIFFLFTQSVITNTETKQKQVASRICQSRIEELRNMDYTTMTGQSQDITIPDLPSGHRITRIKTVAKPGGGTETDMREAEVEVTWTGRQGTKSTKLNTFIYDQSL